VITVSCCTTNDEVDEKRRMKPVVVLETLNLDRLTFVSYVLASELSTCDMQTYWYV